jgi:hypothetical protein
MAEFVPHTPKQERVVFSEKRITVAATGIQWGKSEAGAVRMVRMIHKFPDKNASFIVCAPTFPIMQQATLPTFLEFADGLGEYHRGDKVFEVRGGGRVYFRTGTYGDSVVGIRNTRHIWCDEAGLYSLYFWENIQGRAAPKEATIDLTTSPYSLNWVYKELINPTLKGTRDDVELVQAASNENPYFPDAEYQRRKATMDPRRFRMMFGGDWDRKEGIVYDCFDDDENVIDMEELPGHLIYYAGVDWGYTEPFAIVVVGICPQTHKRYVVAEVKKSRLAPSERDQIVQRMQRLYGVTFWFCGPDRPENIVGLNQLEGVRAGAANNSVLQGIEAVYERIKARELQFVRGRASHVLDELEGYHYPEHKETRVDANVKEVYPVQAEDHCCDALRYAILSTQNIMDVKAPFVPGEAKGPMTQAARIERLFRSSSAGSRKTENWS